jgi:TRAP-type mannitol/chloroaromatic compound transport system substrate-binding protein
VYARRMPDPQDRTRRGISNRAALFAVIVAFAVGLLASLSLRPPSRVVGGGEARAGGEAVRWRLPVAFGTNLPGLGDNAPFVAERIAAASDGRIEVEVFEPGELVPVFAITEAVSAAKVQAGYTWVGYDEGRIPASVLLGSVPFGMEPWEYMGWWYHGGGRELGERVYAPHDVKPILCGLIGPESAGWFREEISSLDDLRGLKIRFAGLGGKVIQRLGASVTMLPGGEIFQALDRGAIDATEYSMPAIDARLGFDRVVQNNYFPGWHQPSTAAHLVVNTRIWQQLAPSDRALIENACGAGVANNLAKGEALQGPVLADYARRGVETRVLPLELLRELETVANEILDEEAAADPLFAEVLASQRAFRADYARWKTLGFLPRDF